ncbi:MAG: hypothetical protein GF344_10230, partial [Chitinivibrionales bacterium]|nr:hypothetical protein [Chitinivibrionales bacterium]
QHTKFGDGEDERLLGNDGTEVEGLSVEGGSSLDSWRPRSLATNAHDQIDNPGTQNESLFEGYLSCGTGETLDVKLSGLAGVGSSCDIYVYLDADDGSSKSDSSIREISMDDVPLFLNDPDGNTYRGEFVEAASSAANGGGHGNYVVFRDVTADSVHVRIDDDASFVGSGNNRPAISAIQIVSGADKNSVVVNSDTERDAVVGDNAVAQLYEGKVYELSSKAVEIGGDDFITTGEDTDVVIGGAGGDRVDGQGGHDLIFGDNANLIMFKGEVIGFDPSQFNDGYHSWKSLDGNDYYPSVFNPYAIEGVVLLRKTVGGDDYLSGGAGDDLLYGQYGDDTFGFAGEGLGRDRIVEAGDSQYEGRPNDARDKLDFSAFAGSIAVDLSEADTQIVNCIIVDGDVNLALTLFSETGIEDVVGGDFDDIIFGNNRENVIHGDALGHSDGGNDIIDAAGGDDTVFGAKGDDIIIGGSGRDSLSGNEGNDTIIGGRDNPTNPYDYDSEEGDDTIHGNEGNDTLWGSQGDDGLYGDEGDDILYGEGGDDLLVGGVGNDKLDGDGGDDLLAGGAGYDTIDGGSGVDLLYFPGATFGVSVVLSHGGKGTATDGFVDASIEPAVAFIDELDRIEGAVGTDFADSMLGDDKCNEFHGGGGDDTIDGGGGGDLLYGDAGDDLLTGERGNDTIHGGTGADTIDAGSGNDTVVWNDGDGNDNVELGSGSDDFKASVGDSDDLVKIENGASGAAAITITSSQTSVLQLSLDRSDDIRIDTAGGNDRVVVDSLSNVDLWRIDVSLGAGDDVLDGRKAEVSVRAFGEQGDDTFIGGHAHDSFDGGEGSDWVDYSLAESAIWVSMGYIVHTDGMGSYDTLEYIENIRGSQFDDFIVGTNGDNEIRGLGGNDRILGCGGDDLIFGGAGDDALDGDEGEDVLYGGEGSDTIDAGNDADIVYGEAGEDIIDGGGGDDSLYGGEGDDTIFGGSGDDLILGDAGDDVLDGEWGNDTIDGGVGNDEIDGGSDDDAVTGNVGNDAITGGSGRDVVFYAEESMAGAQGVIVNLSDCGDGTAVDGFLGLDTLLAIEDITGTRFSDTLTGNQSDNHIYGGGGDDSIDGGGGDDSLYGQAGNDDVRGGDGDDSIEGGQGSDLVDAGEGDDRVYWKAGDGSDMAASLGTGRCDRVYIATTDADEAIGIESSGADTLVVTVGDSLTGSVVDTFAYMSADYLTLMTYGGDDTVVLGDLGSAGIDEVNVDLGDGDDRLDANAVTVATDIVAIGGAGNDLFAGGAGHDEFDGGDGVDWVDYSEATERVRVELWRKARDDGRGSWDTLSNIENVIGTEYDDSIEGSYEANEILGLGGDDWIDGNGGNDVIAGGGGDDTIDGGSGDDMIDGGAGSDTLDGESGDDRIAGGAGNDSIEGGGGTDLLYFPESDQAGAHGVEVILSSHGRGTVFDSVGGTDTLAGGVEGAVGTRFADTLVGNDDENEFYGGAGGDFIDGRGGDDALLGEEGDDTIYGDEGEDTIIGGDGIDAIDAGADDDAVRWFAGDGEDAMVDLGAGRYDTMEISTTDEAEMIVVGSGMDAGVTVSMTAAGGIGSSLSFANADSIRLTTGDGDDTVVIGDIGTTDCDGLEVDLGAGNDLLDAFDGSSATPLTAFGAEGNDTFIGGAAIDSFDGGVGEDWVDYSRVHNGVQVDLSRRADDDGMGAKDYLDDIENVRGSQFGDYIKGSSADNVILGLGGNDRIDGDGGNDEIHGGGGDDTIRGESGNDTIFGEDGADDIDGGGDDDLLDGGRGDDTVDGGYAGTDLLMFGDAGRGVFVKMESYGAGVADDGAEGLDTFHRIDGAVGTEYFDFMIGNDYDNEFHGMGGEDVLRGGGGEDILAGGDGIDLVEGGQGNDLLMGGAENDIAIGAEGNDLLIGGTGDDMIEAGRGETDHLVRQDYDGNDTINGDTGENDQLTILTSGVLNEIITTQVDDDLYNVGRTTAMPFELEVRGVEHIESESVDSQDSAGLSLSDWDLVATDGSSAPSSATASTNPLLIDLLMNGSEESEC